METYKYDMTIDEVRYLIVAVDAQQIRGEQAARNLIAVKEHLANPTNSEELEKKKLEDLKAKYEDVTKKEEKK